jgi:hypothetical protein
LKRGDHGVRWLELLSVGVYWWFPLLGWIRRELRKHEEACCDEWVVAVTNDPRSYADALVETLVFLDGPTPAPFLASGVTPVRDLQRRIRMIMHSSPISRWARLGVVSALCLGLVALAVGPGISQGNAQDGPPPKKRGEDKKTFELKKDFEGRKGFESRDDRRDGEKGERKEVDRKEPAAREEVEKARREVEEARKQMEKAIRALVEAEEKMARAEGRRFEGMRGFGGGGGGGFGGEFFPKDGKGGFPGGFGFGGRSGGEAPAKAKDGDRDREPAKADAPRREERKEGGRPADAGPGPGARGEGRGGDRLEQLEQQLRRLAEELEAVRRDMRRGPEPLPAPRREPEPRKK